MKIKLEAFLIKYPNHSMESPTEIESERFGIASDDFFYSEEKFEKYFEELKKAIKRRIDKERKL